MRVKFLDLSLPTGQVKKRYLQAVGKFLDKGLFILSEEVKVFEDSFAKAIGTKFCIGVSSGADALYLSLLVYGIGPGDEVITQGNAYNASVTAILRTGATPRFVDINQDSLTINAGAIDKLINKKTKAILPVHLYGTGNDMPAIVEIAKQYRLVIIEDCAQAHLAEIQGKKLGSFGHAGAFSFYPTKNLGAFGDAGAIVTSDEEVYLKLLTLRNLGQKEKNNHVFLGFNMRLDPIQAIALSLKLEYLTGLIADRQKTGEYYSRLITRADIPVRPQKILPPATHVYHLYPVQVFNFSRDALQKKLLEAGVESGVYYPVPVYKQPFYKGPFDPCPITDAVCARILCLPMYFGISQKEQEYVVQSLKEILQ